MTDRYNTLTVVLERDIREDDAEYVLNAIRMVRGVHSVTGNVVNASDWMAEERAYEKLRKKIMGVLYPKPDEKA